MRQIDTIIVHCSATRPSLHIGVEEIRKWHVKDNGWSDIGYHFVIPRSGALENGRPIEKAGAHARGHNATSIGICLVGGVDANGAPDANFTAEQYITLRSLIEKLRREHFIEVIIGHRDVEPLKACPCFSIQGLLDNP